LENYRQPPGGAGAGPRHPLPPAARSGRLGIRRWPPRRWASSPWC